MTTSYRADQDSVDSGGDADEKLLDHIRRRFKYHTEQWQKIRERGDEDMAALDPITGPWTNEEINSRDENKRPWVHMDQLNQYINLLVNEVRQNPLAIKVEQGDSVDPSDPEAVERAKQAALLAGNRIRFMEYDQNAAQAIITALEGSTQRGYGVFGIKTEDIAWDDFNQKIKIRRFADPNTVSWDPDCKEADCSDMEDAFVWRRMLIPDFERKYKDAEAVDFSNEDLSSASDWIDKDSIMVAEYWCVNRKSRVLYLLDDGTPQGKKVFKDELPEKAKVKNKRITYPDGTSYEILKRKDAEERSVCQYVTNGLEILEKNEWLGKWIPIFPIVGKEKYTRKNGKTERTLESYIRGGIKGQKLYDLYKSSEAEDIARVPMNLLIGYEGQFATSTPWATIHKKPIPYGEVKANPEGFPAGTVAPIPQLQQHQLRVAELSAGEEGARRAIQAALGSYGFTKNDDTNVKSGKAISLLDRQSDMGSFHFIDNAKCTVRHYGRCVEELLPLIEDTPRTVVTRERDGTHKLERINQPYTENGKTVEKRYRSSKEAAHSVTIDAGASYQSQRQEWKDFTNGLAQNEFIMAKAGDLVIKSQDGGPIGDQIAERIIPPEFKTKDGEQPIPPEAQQQMQQAQQALQALNAHAKNLEEQLAEALDKAKAEQIKADNALRIAEENNKARIAVAQIAAAAKVSLETLDQEVAHMQHVDNVLTDRLGMAHEATQAELDRQHEADQAQRMQQAMTEQPTTEE